MPGPCEVLRYSYEVHATEDSSSGVSNGRKGPQLPSSVVDRYPGLVLWNRTGSGKCLMTNTLEKVNTRVRE